MTSRARHIRHGTARILVRFVRGVGDGLPAGCSRHRNPSERSRISRHPHRHNPFARLRVLGHALFAALVLWSAVEAAVAIEVQPPQAPTAPAAGAAPPPPAAATAAPRAVSPPTPSPEQYGASSGLRIGMSGPFVRELQVQLRRRGARLNVDGVFGPATRRAVVALQRRFRIARTGIANARLLDRLGLRAHTVSRSPVLAAGRPSALLRVFPVAGVHSFSDDWGAPRAQGSHEGTDILAARGVPVVAADDAVVDRLTRTESGLGGIYVWLRRADGTEYYYAHLDSIAPGLDAGSTVSAGDVIGANGNTGDARYGETHVHFEIHPRGGGPVNPFTHLVAVDPDR